MWKAQAGLQINTIKNNQADDDDWETDPDFENNVTEEEQRWGSTTIEGSGRTAGAINMDQLRRETEEAYSLKKKEELLEGANSSFGYGGKFGVEQDRMDQSAMGHDYVAKVEKHGSQTDYSTGFGGKYGVQNDRVDKSAAGWDHKEKIAKHTSQKDYSSGFGGKFGVQTDRQDKSAVGWDHVEKVEKHESQKDYSKGFGGKFGVQSDRQDKSAVGWDHHEAPQKHESQTDHSVGFGGKFGVQTDRMDKSAVTFSDEPTRIGTTYTKTKPDIGTAKPSEMRAKFEQMKEAENSTRSASSVAPAQRSTVHARAAAFNAPSNETTQIKSANERAPKQLDQSKTAFLTQQTSQSDSAPSTPKATPGQLDQTKISQFAVQNPPPTETSSANQIKEELEQLKLSQQQKQEEPVEEEIYQNLQQPPQEVEEKFEPTDQIQVEEPQNLQEDEIADTGLTAIALFDYQAGAEDEISFDPDDVITHVEKIDEGWWRGMCKGHYGLFPANYVELQQN